jgi:hypothetical protein
MASAAQDLLSSAGRSLAEAMLASSPADRYVAAHLAALRAGAAVLATRGRPASRRTRVQSVWVLLPRVAPELGEWAAFFAMTAKRRAAAESGLAVIALRDADDLVRDAEAFLRRVSDLIGVPHQEAVRFAS